MKNKLSVKLQLKITSHVIISNSKFTMHPVTYSGFHKSGTISCLATFTEGAKPGFSFFLQLPSWLIFSAQTRSIAECPPKYYMHHM